MRLKKIIKMLRSASNPKILHLLQLRKSREARQRHQTFLVTGEKFIREAMKVAPVQLIMSSDPLPTDMQEVSPVFFQTEARLLSKITGFSLQQGMVAEFAQPKPSSFSKISKLLVLERITDPGNLGAIIRSQIAFGWEQLFLLPGCCDLFNEKVVRASAAALFHVQWHEGSWEELKALVHKNKLTPLIADMKGESLEKVTVTKPCLLLSNEASGLSKEASVWGSKIAIPMSKKIESLNAAVAASLLLYRLK